MKHNPLKCSAVSGVVASRAEAWIETQPYIAMWTAQKRRLPCGGVKLGFALYIALLELVASRAEAWIETLKICMTRGECKVASRAEAWIETPKISS